MDFEVTLPPLAQSITPLMVTAPTHHAGTTLVQQAINTSRNGLCYGDNLFEELLSVIEWATSVIEAHHNSGNTSDDSLEAALARELDGWAPELAPSFSLHMSSVFSTIYNVPGTAQSFAEENGFDVWAMIRADMPVDLLVDLLGVFPGGKAIVLQRNPFDVAAATVAETPDTDLGLLCESWNLGMDGLLKVKHERMTPLKYEDAEADPAAFVTSLSALTGIADINVDRLAANLATARANVPPLAVDQRARIAGCCEDMLAAFYPELA